MKPSHQHILPSQSRLFAPDQIDRDLVRDFLFLFSRAEYALKACGFVRGGRYDEPIVEWRKFARTLGKDFSSNDPELVRAREYLLGNPPKQQKVRDGQLAWSDWQARDDENIAEYLIESAKHVRNNLFHGGKQSLGRLAERDRKLLKAALLVIAHAISLHPEASVQFREYPPEAYTAGARKKTS